MEDLGTSDGVRIERDGACLVVTLASPDNRNAQTPATWRRLAAVEDFVDASVRVVLVRAEGRSFSAGLDRRMMTPDGVPGEPSILSLAAMEDEQIDAFISQAQAGFTWWSRSSAISIAVVQGHAVGAGCQLALACDLILAADDAQFAMRETSLGLVPDLAGTSPLVERIGYQRALEMCATGRFIHSEEALRIGLVHSVLPLADLDRGARDLATALCSAPVGAVHDLKPLLRHAIGAEPAQQQAMERRMQMRRIADLRQLLGQGQA